MQKWKSVGVACTSTWPLLRGAGNDPLHQAAFHQRFAREPRSLPLGTLRLFTLIWILSFGVRHHAAIHHLLILLKKIRNTPKMAALNKWEADFLSPNWPLTTVRSPFVEIMCGYILYPSWKIFKHSLGHWSAADVFRQLWVLCRWGTDLQGA